LENGHLEDQKRGEMLILRRIRVLIHFRLTLPAECPVSFSVRCIRATALQDFMTW